MSRNAELAALIRSRAGAAAPEYGFILGSGLGHLSAQVDGTAIPYDELPGFPHAGVSGHVPHLVIGDLEGRRVAVFGGRAHYYESGRADAMRLPLEVLAELGMPQDAPTELYVDNSGAEALARERKVTHNSRHISRRYFKVREYQADGLLTVKHVNTSENPSDVLTKPASFAFVGPHLIKTIGAPPDISVAADMPA